MTTLHFDGLTPVQRVQNRIDVYQRLIRTERTTIRRCYRNAHRFPNRADWWRQFAREGAGHIRHMTRALHDHERELAGLA